MTQVPSGRLQASAESLATPGAELTDLGTSALRTPNPDRGKIRHRVRTRPSFVHGMFLLWLLIFAFLFGYPIIRIFVLSFHGHRGFTFDNFNVLAKPALLKAAVHSLLMGAGSALGSCLIAVPMAYLVARTDMPFKRAIRVLTTMSYGAPSFVAALGWLLLLGPRNGLLNRPFHYFFGWSTGPFNAFSPWTVVFMLIFFLYPLIFLQVSAAFDNLDSALEDAAQSLGAGRLRTFTKVTLPLLLPAITSGALLAFVLGAVLFGPVAILGTPVGFDTIPTEMLKLISYPPQLETEAVISVPVLVIIGALIVVQRRLLGSRRFTVIGGKPGHGRLVLLKGWRIPASMACLGVFVIGLALPYGALVFVTFEKAVGAPLSASNFHWPSSYVNIWHNSSVMNGFIHSFGLALATVVFGVIVALLAAWLVNRTKLRLRSIVAPTMLVPLALPGAVLGVALIIVYGSFMIGSLWILFLAYATLVTPLAFSFINAGIQQMGPESEEAARSLGANWFRTWGRVTLPLLRSSLVGVALIEFVFIFRELDASVFLFNGQNATAATVLYHFADRGDYQVMGTVAIYILAINFLVVLASMRWVNNNRNLA